MNSQSPYCITTNSGKLQLTKGAYLTLIKRKNSIVKTLQKSKAGATSSMKQNKKTIKKSYNDWKDKQKIQSLNQINHMKTSSIIHMTSQRNGKFMTTSFVVKPDREVFNFPMIPNVPLIEMQCDNDCESEWPDIEECVNNMSMSLSLAIFDNNNPGNRKDFV